MYKLFLCLRYLISRILAWFAMFAVTLCVAMMLIVVSVMNGFLDKIEVAAKGLFGDIVVDGGMQGVGNYDQFISLVRKEVPEVEAASPFILSYGMIRIPGTDYRRAVQIAGIRLPERVDVSSFGRGLSVQAGQRPTFEPPLDKLIAAVEDYRKFTLSIQQRERARLDGMESAGTARGAAAEEVRSLLERLDTALSRQAQAMSVLKAARRAAGEAEALRKQIGDLQAAGKGEDDPQLAALREKQLELEEATRFRGPERRVILGLGIEALTRRTAQGETIRFMVPGHEVHLYVFPLGKQLSAAEVTPNREALTVVDDSRTDVSTIDSEFVYVPFETLQRLNNMGPEEDLPARCNQIHIKVAGQPTEADLQRVAARIDALWSRFHREHPRSATTEVTVQTWRQRQMRLIAPIESQRTLVVVMFGVISLVAVVLMIVIFYMIVVQKTRDIGVLKAVGASSGGVAGIWLLYGAVVGLIGSLAGTALGCVFVWNINPIHDWVAQHMGLRVWSREFFLFEKIPNDVNWVNALVIVGVSILAGVVGALVAAIRAATMQPVEALRYE